MSPFEPSCDGVPYEDGAYWRAINRGAPGTASLVVVQCVKPPPPPGLFGPQIPAGAGTAWQLPVGRVRRGRHTDVSQRLPLGPLPAPARRHDQHLRRRLRRVERAGGVAVSRRLLTADSVVIEVGANLGLHTVPLAKIASSGRVICLSRSGLSSTFSAAIWRSTTWSTSMLIVG